MLSMKIYFLFRISNHSVYHDTMPSIYEDSNGLAMAQKLEPIGGKGGKQWDDGIDHDYVTKVYIRGGREGIHYIKFNYVKDGQSIDGLIHGVSGDGFTHTVCFIFFYLDLFEIEKKQLLEKILEKWNLPQFLIFYQKSF